MIQWLEGLNGCIGRIVYDTREDEYILALKVKPENYHTYEAYNDSTNICRVLAKNFDEAWLILEVEIIKNHNKLYHDWWAKGGMLRILNYHAPKTFSILELTTI